MTRKIFAYLSVALSLAIFVGSVWQEEDGYGASLPLLLLALVFLLLAVLLLHSSRAVQGVNSKSQQERVIMTDERLREKVMDEIDWVPEITSTDINVADDGGVVTLTGFVHSHAERLAAERAAKRVYGVRAVANDIEVKPGTERTDPEIARDAVEALEMNTRVPSDRIKVTVKDGRLVLEGTVPWGYQKNAAESAVKFIDGVRRVFNEIKVRPTVSTTEVKAKIEDALRRHALTDARRIRVVAHDGTVELWGNVSALAERDDAERAAWAAPGVSEVNNHLLVMP